MQERNNERADRIYYALKERICTNAIRPGEFIYETQVAEEFGVSRTPVSRIFARLERDGLIKTRRGVGSCATDLDLATFEDCYGLRIRLAELLGMDIRAEALPDVIERLEELGTVARGIRHRRDYLAIGRVNVGVMYAILELVGNIPLKEIMESLYFRTTRVWHAAIPNLDWDQEVSLVIAEIEALLRSLKLGDYVTFGYVRRNYTSLAYQRLKQRWKSSGG